jgi:hypothetical protein
MRKGLFVHIFLLVGMIGYGQAVQDTLKGSVTYKTSLNIYVKFESTKEISIGDTLYSNQQGALMPVIIVHQLSTTSCVGSPINNSVINLSDPIFSLQEKPIPAKTEPAIPSPIYQAVMEAEQKEEPVKTETPKAVQVSKAGPAFRGRISAASYINFANTAGYDVQRMRYTFTLNSREPVEKGFSAETYMSFRHTINEWQDVKDNFKKAMKVYTLSVQYKLNKSTRFWLGRKINFNISNLGAIDGIQAEKQWKHIIVGSFLGSRPDNLDYGINLHLLQYGAYLTHVIENKKGQVLSTIAIAEQQNHGVTDRRFLYFQHQNSTIKNISIFASTEIDLYTVKNNQPQSTFLLSSIYASVRYRVSSKLSFFGSYDARKNIIYYETYKSFIDQLLEDEMRQGMRFSFNYRPMKKVTLGANVGYRFERLNPHPAQNINSYLTVNQFSPLRISTTISAVLLQTSYLKGNIYGIRISKDFMKGKLYEEVEFRTVSYRYGFTELPIQQKIIGLNTSIRMSKKLSLSINYEGEIQSNRTLHRIYSNIVYRL